MGFIEDYTKEMRDRTGAEPKIIKATAIFLFSSVLNRNVKIATSVGDQYLNLWFFIVSRSGTRKSTVLRDWCSSFLYRLDKKLVLPDEFTPEALFSVLAVGEGESSYGAYIRDEASGFFSSATKDYMLGIMEKLSLVYDGKTVVRVTKGGGREEIVDPYLTMVLAGTPHIYNLLEEGMFRQGFLNRFLYITSDKILPFTEMHTADGYKTLIETRNRLINELGVVHNLKEDIVFMMAPSAESKWNLYRKRLYKDIIEIQKDEDSFVPEYLLRLGDSQVLKLATIFELNKRYKEIIEDASVGLETIFSISVESMEEAIEYAEVRKKDYFLFLDKFMLQSEPRKVITHEREIERCLKKIKEAGADGVKRKDLIRSLKWHADFLDPILNTLQQSEQINVEIIKGKTKNTILYKPNV